MKRDFAVGGDNAAAQAWRWFSVLRSFHHDVTSPSARRKRQSVGELAVEFWMEYADALAEAGSGKTCAVDCRLRTPVMSFRRALCGEAKKNVTVTSCMELLWWS